MTRDPETDKKINHLLNQKGQEREREHPTTNKANKITTRKYSIN